MSLTEKLRQTGKAILVAGGLSGMAYNSGCTPLAIVGGAAIIAKSNRDAAEIEARSRENADGKENQRNNWSNLDIYEQKLQAKRNDPHYKLDTPWGDLLVVACKYFGDFNNNGRIEYPEECIGISNRFYGNEKINLILSIDMESLNKKPFENIQYQLIDGDGRIVEKSDGKDTFMIISSYNLENVKEKDVPNGQVNYLKSGVYEATWRSEGQVIARWNFVVE